MAVDNPNKGGTLATTAPAAGRGVGARGMGPAQLFCLVVGAVLIVAGIIGFFYNGSFSSGADNRDAVFGILDVNGWHNVVHLLTGAVTLAAARTEASARAWALIFGIVYLAVAIWGFIIGDGDAILSIIPVNTEDNILHTVLAIGALIVHRISQGEANRRVTA
jgi:hypothetical protein